MSMINPTPIAKATGSLLHGEPSIIIRNATPIQDQEASMARDSAPNTAADKIIINPEEDGATIPTIGVISDRNEGIREDGIDNDLSAGIIAQWHTAHAARSIGTGTGPAGFIITEGYIRAPIIDRSISSSPRGIIARIIIAGRQSITIIARIAKTIIGAARAPV
jgi:hypothetical protein